MFSYVEVFARLGSSYGFLSMIFGILGKFWIDIGVQKNFIEKIFVGKKPQTFFENCLVENFWSRKFSTEKTRFWNFGILDISKFRDFENLFFFGKLRKTIKTHIFEICPGLKVSSRQYYWRWKQRLWCRHNSGICNFRICDPSRRKIRSLPCTQASPWGVRRLVYL